MSPVSACQSCSAVIGNFLVLWHTVYKYICCLKDSSIAMIGQLSRVKIIRNGKISNLTESQHKHPKPVSLIRQYFLSHRCQELSTSTDWLIWFFWTVIWVMLKLLGMTQPGTLGIIRRRRWGQRMFSFWRSPTEVTGDLQGTAVASWQAVVRPFSKR